MMTGGGYDEKGKPIRHFYLSFYAERKTDYLIVTRLYDQSKSGTCYKVEGVNSFALPTVELIEASGNGNYTGRIYHRYYQSPAGFVWAPTDSIGEELTLETTGCTAVMMDETKRIGNVEEMYLNIPNKSGITIRAFVKYEDPDGVMKYEYSNPLTK